MSYGCSQRYIDFLKISKISFSLHNVKVEVLGLKEGLVEVEDQVEGLQSRPKRDIYMWNAIMCVNLPQSRPG